MTLETAVYLTIPTIALEIVLMVSVYLLNPQDRRNQTYALYMLLLALNGAGILILMTAFTPQIAIFGAWLNAVTALMSGPAIWLVVFITFAPPQIRRPFFSLPLLLLITLPVLFILWDTLTGTTLLIDLSQVPVATNSFMPLRQYLSGIFAPYFYLLNVVLLNGGVGLPLIIFAFMPHTDKTTRKTLVYLFTGFVLAGVIAVKIRLINPVLGGIVDPLLVAIITGIVLSRFRVLSPVVSGMRQAVDNANFGLIVFEKEWHIVEVNQTATRLLRLPTSGIPDFKKMMAYLVQQAENPLEINDFARKVLQNPVKMHEVELILLQHNLHIADDQRYLIVRIEPIFEKEKTHIGFICSVYDLTTERQAQKRLAKTNQALQEQVVYIARLNEITLTATSGIDLPELLQFLADQLGDLFTAEGCYVTLWDEAQQLAIPAAAYGTLRESYPHIRTFPHEKTITQAVLELERPLLVDNLYTSPYISPRLAKKFPEQTLLALPLIVADQKLGAALIAYNHSSQLNAVDIARGEQVAGQIALALAKSKSLHAEREQRVFAESLREAGTALSASLDLDTVLDRILQSIAPVVPYDSANLMLVQGSEVQVVRWHGYEQYAPRAAALIQKLCLSIPNTPNLQQMWETKRPLIVPDIFKNDTWVHLDGLDHFHSWAGAPIVAQEKVIAFFSLEKKEANFYHPVHAQKLASFAGQAALALQNARWFAEIQQRQQELETLFALSTALHKATTVQEIFAITLQNGIDLLNSSSGCILFAEPGADMLTVQVAYPPYTKESRKQLPRTHPFIQKALTDTPCLHTSIPFTDTDHPISQAPHYLTLAIQLPGQTVGVMLLSQNEPTLPDKNSQLLMTLTEMAGNALQRALIVATLEQQVQWRTQELLASNARLTELDQLKSKLINDISHELRTPITNIQLYLDLMERGQPEKYPKYLNVLQEKIKTLIHLTEDIFRISQLNLQKDKADLYPVNLNQIARALVDEHTSLAANANLELIFTPADDLPMVMAEKTLLRQSLAKFLDNALLYTTQGNITITTEYSNQQVRFIVGDTGMGIPADELPHIFDRLYRGKRVSQSTIPGSGLGLAIAKEIIDLHDGTIFVKSDPQIGSRFCICFPPVLQSEDFDTLPAQSQV
ncbi:MAG: GAF domain-containing protein [Chloroflexota bacterium]